MSKQRRTQGERSDATRTALMDAARGLFVERGYRNVAADEIVRRAGVTRGALYHHFPAGKLDLFRSVLERLEVELDGAIRARVTSALNAQGVSPIRAAVLGLAPYFDLAGDPGFARMMLVDAPALLGPTCWRDIDAGWGIRQFAELLALFIDLGIYEAQPIAPLAHMLYGAAVEAALYLAGADDKAAARGFAEDACYRLLAGLAAPSVQAGDDRRRSWDESPAGSAHPPMSPAPAAPDGEAP